MPKRTSRLLITARFLLMCSPIGIVLALIFSRIYIGVLVGYFGGVILCWLFSMVFTNTVVKIFDPIGYRELKKAGGNAFFDSLGAPLNFDSEQVRMQNDNPQPIQYQNLQRQMPSTLPPKQPPKQRKLWNGQNIGHT